ncbi:MAG: DNA polymerase III subunit delta' [Pseudacidovorax sp.]|nr:DNA polymerase III subunit delta' [Pseudacidovorax sp.]
MAEVNEAPALSPWLARARDQLLRQRGHALLLQGPSGLGQYDLALALAAAWLCEQPTSEGACGHCPSCHAIAVRTHADLAVLMPEVAMMELGWPIDEKAQAEIDDKKRKPSREIRVEAMRDAVGFAQRTSGRGRGKVVLVYPAERMNAISANALLKTLEEPVGDVRFVLATEAAWQLLPTIRSRCQAFTLPWPAEGESEAWLATQGVPAAEAHALLRAAGGRPSDALRLARGGTSAKGWSLLPQAMRRGDVTALADQPPPAAIDTLQKLCHDLMAVAAGGQPRFFEAASLPTPPSAPVLARWSASLLKAARTAEHPFNAGLMIEALVSEAHAALNSRSPERP